MLEALDNFISMEPANFMSDPTRLQRVLEIISEVGGGPRTRGVAVNAPF